MSIILFALSVFELKITQLIVVMLGCLVVMWILGKSLFEYYRELNSRKKKEYNREHTTFRNVTEKAYSNNKNERQK